MISVIGAEHCLVVYLNPPLGVCQQRDPSGLYAAEANTPTGNVPGVSSPYEAPAQPDLMLPTHEIDVDECVDRVLNLMKERELI
jgi:bifunctional enzyme CysN/CysC